MGHIVTAPLVITPREDGSSAYLYQGAPVPASTTEEEIARLLEGGFIAEVEEAVVVPEGDPNSDWKIDQLTAYAGTLGIDLGAAKKKDEILAAIAAASA